VFDRLIVIAAEVSPSTPPQALGSSAQSLRTDNALQGHAGSFLTSNGIAGDA